MDLTPVVAEVDYPFLNILWTMLIIFAWVIWFWTLIVVAGDVFRRRDIGGGRKGLWLVFLIFVPFIGVIAYLVVNGDGIAERNLEQVRRQQGEMDAYIRSVSGGATEEIARAKELLDSGAISQTEFDQIKAKALG